MQMSIAECILLSLDDKYRGAASISVPLNLPYDRVLEEMRRMADKGIIERHPSRAIWRRRSSEER